MLRTLTLNLNRAGRNPFINTTTQEKKITSDPITPLATPESSLIIDHKLNDPSSHLEQYASLLTPFKNRPEIKKLQETIKGITTEISKAEQKEYNAIENKNISSKEKAMLVDAHTCIHGYAATKTIKNEIAKLATKLEQGHDPNHTKLSETLRDLETLMRATAHQFKGMAIVQSLEHHVLFEKGLNYSSLENARSPGNEVKTSSSAEIGLGVSSSMNTSPLIKTGVNLTLVGKKTKTTTQDGYNSFSQKHEQQVEGKLAGNVNLLSASAKIEGSVTRTLTNNTYKADSLDKIIKHNAITSNNGRLNISNPKAQPYYEKLATLKNTISYVINDKAINPHFPHYATSEALANANCSQSIIQNILEKYNFTPEKEPVLNINDIDCLSKGSTAASREKLFGGKTTKAKSNPDKKTALSLKSEFSAATTIPTLSKNTAIQGLIANMLPKLSGTANLAYTMEFAASEGITLKPPHEFLSTTFTHNIDNSLKQAHDLLMHWKDKQIGAVLPIHLQDTQALFEKLVTPIKPDMLTQHIEESNTALDKLNTNFTQFKVVAQQFIDLTHHSVNFESPTYKQKYNQLLSEIQSHQFDADKLPMIPQHQTEKYGASDIKKPSRAQAQDMIGKIWDSYSLALGVIEQATVAPFKQLDGLTQSQKDQYIADFPTLPKQLEIFGEKYEQANKEFADPGLPLALEKLYRYASIEAPASTSKITHTLKGEGSVSQSLNTTLGATEKTAGGFSIKTSIPTKVTNPLENLSTKTVTQSIRHNHLFTQPSNQLTDQIANQLEIKDASTRDALQEMLTQQRKVAILQEITKPIIIRPPKNSVIRTLCTLKDNYEGASQTKGAEFSITHAGNQLQKIGLTSTYENSTKAGYGGSGKTNNLGISGNFGLSRNIASTKTEISMMGPEFSQNLSNFKNMEEFDIGKKTIKGIKENMTHPDGVQTDALKAQFSKFFDIAQMRPQIHQHYFGLNALGDFLTQFSHIKTEEEVTKDKEGQFKLSGFNLFNQNVVDTYFEKKSAEKFSAKNILSVLIETNTSNNIFEKTGIEPTQVKQLLESKIDPEEKAMTVAQFLETANDQQRMNFFKNNKIGIELFAAYLLVLNQAKDIKDVFTTNNLHLTNL